MESLLITNIMTEWVFLVVFYNYNMELLNHLNNIQPQNIANIAYALLGLGIVIYAVHSFSG